MIPEKHGKKIVAPGLETYIDVEITASQLLSMNSVVKVLVPAPIASRHLIFLGAIVRKLAGTAYTVAGGSDLAVKYTGTSGLALAQLETVGFLDSTSELLRYIFPFQAASGNSGIVPATGAAIVLQTLSADVTVGNAEQAKVVLGYLTGIIRAIPALAMKIVADRQDEVELDNGVIIGVKTSDYRAVRGITIVCCVGDEVAFWNFDSESANTAHARF